MDQHYEVSVEPHLLGQQKQETAQPPQPQCQEAKASDTALLDVLRRVPKTDFHCHLNGSITPSLLAHMERLLLQEHRRCRARATVQGSPAEASLGRADSEDNAEEDLMEAEEGHMLFFNTQEKRLRNVLASPTTEDAAGAPPGASASHSSPKDRMHYCFTVFDAVYKIMTSLAFTRLAVQDMLFCSAAESIMAMEIRTSLRDGLCRSFRPVTAAQPGQHQGKEGATGPDSAAVSKQMYVETVIETVEHLLSGGLVDFQSGELLSLADSADILAHPQSTLSSEEEEETKMLDMSATGSQAAAWWRVYDRVYGALFPVESVPPASSPSSAFPLCKASAVDAQLRRRFFVDTVQSNLTHRMHVRLLLSINRGADEEAAWAASRLTTQTQQRQIRRFHSWCFAAAREPAAVREELRRTCWVTGMDLSGNCYKGLYATFNAALAAARSGSASSLTSSPSVVPIRTTAAVTIHGGEKQDAEELSAMVAFAPERWGHLVFTDDHNLSAILAAQQGIELCLTSNLLTSGHVDVAEHHLGHLLHLWETMNESHAASPDGAASPSGCYAATKAARLRSRLAFAARRWEAATDLASPVEGKATFNSHLDDDVRCSYVLPNISFHTDDRGVFGTTLSHELLLASQHPGVGQMASRLTGTTASSTKGAARFFWQLERLSLLQIFELPVPVQLLAVLLIGRGEVVREGAESQVTDASAADCAAAVLALVASEEGSSAVKVAGRGWEDWHTFVHYCANISARETTKGASLPSALSAWEWAWLTEAFDHYYE